MKLAAITSGIILGATLLFASSAFADSGKLQLFEKVSVDGHILKPGDYKVEWNRTGNNVDLQIMKNGDVVATAPAKIQNGNPQDADGYTTTTKKNGTVSLKEVFFGNKKWTFEIEPAKAGSNSSHSGS